MGGTSHEKNFAGTYHSGWVSFVRTFAGITSSLPLAKPTWFDVGGVFCRPCRIVSGPVHKPSCWVSVQGNTLSGRGNDQECCDNFFGVVRSVHVSYDVVRRGKRQQDENELDSYLRPTERPTPKASRNGRIYSGPLARPVFRQSALRFCDRASPVPPRAILQSPNAISVHRIPRPTSVTIDRNKRRLLFYAGSGRRVFPQIESQRRSCRHLGYPGETTLEERWEHE